MAVKFNRIAFKLFAVCLSFALPITVLLFLMIDAKNKDIEFAAMEKLGDLYQRPLELLLKDLSLHRWAALRLANGDSSQASELQATEAAADKDLAALLAVNAEIGVTLQFTEEGLAKRKRNEFTAENLEKSWTDLKTKQSTMDSAAVQAAHDKLIAHISTMITHMGDTSNLILDPDLDSYYFMDVTLLALPQTQNRLQNIAVFVETVTKAGKLTAADRIQASVYSAFLKEADLDRINASSQTALNEDQNFYGVSPSLQKKLPPALAKNTPLVEAVIADLKALGEVPDVKAYNVVSFRAHLRAALLNVYDFHAMAFHEEDILLKNRIADIQGQKSRAFVWTSLSLAIAALLAFAITSGLIRRVKRVIGVTRTIANGDLNARVGMKPGDEVSELAQSFDVMTAKVVGLNEEVARKNRDLQGINANLEGIVAERTATIKTILDSVKFGFLIVGSDGKVQDGFSKSCQDLLGKELVAGVHFMDAFKLREDRNAGLIQEFLGQAFDDIMPEEMTLQQLPPRITHKGRTLALQTCTVRGAKNEVKGILFTIIDATDLQRAEREGARQALLVRILKEADAFRDFVEETKTRVGMCRTFIRSNHPAKVRAELHTIKGNTSAFDLIEAAKIVHAIEDQKTITEADIDTFESALRAFLDENFDVLQISYDEGGEDTISLSSDQIDQMLERLSRVPAGQNVHQEAVRWAAEARFKTARSLIGALPDYAKRLAARLCKSIDVIVEGGDIRMDPEVMRTTTQSLVHLVRNSIDHGIEDSSERQAKPGVAQLKIIFGDEPMAWSVKVVDDGKGIDGDRVANNAVSKGLLTPEQVKSMSAQEKLSLIFMNGLSTSETISEVSGRGVGMSAVESTVKDSGGKLELDGKLGRGTTITITIPKPEARGMAKKAA